MGCVSAFQAGVTGFESLLLLHTFVVQWMNGGLLSHAHASSSLVEGANTCLAQWIVHCPAKAKVTRSSRVVGATGTVVLTADLALYLSVAQRIVQVFPKH